MTRDDPNVKTSSPPFEWVCLMYRERFGLSHEEFRKIEPRDFFADLQMLEVEADVSNAKSKKRAADMKKLTKK